MALSRDELKTHYNTGTGAHTCGLSRKYKSVNGINNVPLVTCVRCMRSLLANGGGMVKYKRDRIQKIKGRWYRFPGQVVPTKGN